MGQAFYQTGSGKIANFANTVGFFTELGIPFPEANAFLVSRLEFWGGLLLVVGLLTRVVAAGLASTMVVALATADRATFLGALAGSGDAGLTDVVPFVYLLLPRLAGAVRPRRPEPRRARRAPARAAAGVESQAS